MSGWASTDHIRTCSPSGPTYNTGAWMDEEGDDTAVVLGDVNEVETCPAFWGCMKWVVHRGAEQGAVNSRLHVAPLVNP